MHIVCQREPLLAAVRRAASAVPARHPKPVLACLYLAADAATQSLVLRGTDLEVAAAVSLGAEAAELQVVRSGVAVLPAARLAAILAESSSESIDLTAGDDRAVLRLGQARFEMPLGDWRDFPESHVLQTEPLGVDAAALAEAIGQTVLATEPDATRYALGGVRLETGLKRLFLVGCDGRRLASVEIGAAMADGEWNPPEGWLAELVVPAKACRLMARLLGSADRVWLHVDGPILSAASADTALSARLLEGRYPRWRDIIPDTKTYARWRVAAGVLAAAVRQAAIVTSRERSALTMDFDGDRLRLTADGAELGTAEVELPLEPVKPGKARPRLNAGYLREMLASLPAERIVTLKIGKANQAILLEADGYTGVIMPMADDPEHA